MSELSFERRLSELENRVKDLITQKMFQNLISMNNHSLASKIADELDIRDRLQDWQIRYLDYVLKGEIKNE